MSDDLPGMWEEADLIGGQTDADYRRHEHVELRTLLGTDRWTCCGCKVTRPREEHEPDCWLSEAVRNVHESQICTASKDLS